MIIDVQVNPAVLSYADVVDVALEAEAAGFRAFHVFDHFAGVAVGGETMLECFTLLGALTQRTTTIELGTLVVNVWNRQVGLAVAAAASVATLADRPFFLGIGAGTSPSSRWATEQTAVGAHIEPSLAGRHQRVARFIELADEQWRDDHHERFATFPRPPIRPTIVVGVNSVELSALAGRMADGINVRWGDPRAGDYLAAARAAAGERPFLSSAYALWDEGLLDPEHPDRVAMAAAGIERLALVAYEGRPRIPDRLV